MRKATRQSKEMRARVSTMIVDDKMYEHDPTTIGHAKHTADCWTMVLWTNGTPDDNPITRILDAESAAKGESA